MIIADLSYQETAINVSTLEGGMDLSISASRYSQRAFSFKTASTASSNSSSMSAELQSLEINSSSFGAVLLGADSSSANGLIKSVLASFL